jgi:hypothetical protein
MQDYYVEPHYRTKNHNILILLIWKHETVCVCFKLGFKPGRFTVKRPRLKQTQTVLFLFQRNSLKKLSGSVMLNINSYYSYYVTKKEQTVN